MDKLRMFFAVLVAIVWASVYTVSIIDRTFSAPPEVSGIMLAVVTALFGSEIRERLKGKA
jgi:hypothetical protein